VLREISGAKRAEVSGDWIKLHSKELCVRLGSSNQGHCDWRQCGKYGQKIHTVLARKPGAKKYTWKTCTQMRDNIKKYMT
jgi:hypothetical protein